MRFTAFFADGPKAGELRVVDEPWQQLLRFSVPMPASFWHPDAVPTPLPTYGIVTYEPVWTDEKLYGGLPRVHYRLRKSMNPNQISGSWIHEPNTPMPASAPAKSNLLSNLSLVVGRIEQDEERLSFLKTELKSQRKQRDEILAQLAELDVVVDGV